PQIVASGYLMRARKRSSYQLSGTLRWPFQIPCLASLNAPLACAAPCSASDRKLACCADSAAARSAGASAATSRHSAAAVAAATVRALAARRRLVTPTGLSIDAIGALGDDS